MYCMIIVQKKKINTLDGVFSGKSTRIDLDHGVGIIDAPNGNEYTGDIGSEGFAMIVPRVVPRGHLCIYATLIL